LERSAQPLQTFQYIQHTTTSNSSIMAQLNGVSNALPEGILSLLDTDLYKLTMQCAILKYLPNVGRPNPPP